MKKDLISTLVIATTLLVACQQKDSAKTEVSITAEKSKKPKTMTNKNLVSIIEIPTKNFSRAVQFYQSISNLELEQVDMGTTKMGVFPGNDDGVNLTLVNGDDYKPTLEGTVVYLKLNDDIQSTLKKVTINGGKVLVPETLISPDMGSYALFTDTEGNKIGLHSKN